MQFDIKVTLEVEHSQSFHEITVYFMFVNPLKKSSARSCAACLTKQKGEDAQVFINRVKSFIRNGLLHTKVTKCIQETYDEQTVKQTYVQEFSTIKKSLSALPDINMTVQIRE